MASRHNGEDDENYCAAFGEYTDVSLDCRDEVNQIKNNDPALTAFHLSPNDAEQFTDLAWELMGGYIANNVHLDDIDLEGVQLTDSKISLLFRGLAEGGPLKVLDLAENNFGIDGIRSMVPFLTNARNLRTLSIGENSNINTECFSLLVEALHVGGTIEKMLLNSCGVDDITALDQFLLPHIRILDLDYNNVCIPTSLENYTNLERLYLSSNKIGREGCISIAKLLQKEGLRLRDLRLFSTGMGDDEAEILLRLAI